MSQRSHVGRHRPDTSFNPVSELSSIARAAVGPGARAGSVLVASGGLVATFALPATAAPRTEEATYVASAQSASAFAAQMPRAVTAAPAVVAPKTAAPVATETVGVVGVKAVAKPKPKPKPPPAPEPVAAPTSSSSGSSSSGSSSSSPAPAPAPAPKPVANVPQSSSGVVNIARGLLGIPYVYGGTTPAGFDCSGFTSYVFGKAGISLPRTAAQQQAAATPVSNPQPGDLVFFGAPAWHVGIYTGNGMMIDSPRAGKSTSERPIFSGVSGYGRF